MVQDDKLIIVGRVSGLYGVRGWVKVYSYTAPRENILRYPTWYLGGTGSWQPATLAEGRPHGKGLVARVEGCDDRDAAALLIGQQIAIERDMLPPLVKGEYYWSDLIGLTVVTETGVELGRIDSMLETGANDVMVVRSAERERLIPYVQGDVIKQIDLEQGRICVDWDPEF
jgi:16S rRNA processing protein RimM